jgi:photosystem II stability/assembly factor-like uncharacterized protein
LTASITIDIAPATRRTYLPLIEKQPIMSAVPSWRAGSGLADHVVYQLSSTSATCNVLFAGADNGAYRSGDGGQTWTPVLAATAATWRPQRAFDGAAAPSSALTPSVAVCPANPNVVYLTRWGEGVYRSQDDGATWQPRNGGLGDLWIYALAVSPANCDIVYAATNEHGVWQSTNGGVSWQPRNNGLGNLTSRSIALAPGNPQRLFVGTTGGIWRSDNGGSSWAPTAGLPAATVWSLAVASNDPGQVLAAVEGAGVYTSINAGVSWQERNTGLSSRRVRTLAIDPADAQHVVVGIDQGGGVYHSSDGGQNWTPLNDGLGNRNVKRIWLAGGMCDRLHAGTTNGAWYYQP